MTNTTKLTKSSKTQTRCPSNRLPIYLSNWVVEHNGTGNTVVRESVRGVIVKGADKNSILASQQYLRRALFTLFGKTKSRTQIDEIITKYRAVSVELIKQIGFGIIE